MTKKLVIFLCAICWAVCLAASSSSTENAEDTASSIVSTDLWKSHDTRISIFPFAFYNPEVDLAFGAGGVITGYTAEDSTLRPSKISLSGWYSTSKQYSFGLAPQAYFLGNRFFASLKLFIQDKLVYTPDPVYPEVEAKVYGIESEVRIPAFLGYNTKDRRRKLGIILDYKHVETRYDDEETGEEDIPFDDPPHTLGIGTAWIWDSRDNIFYPTSGHLHRLKVAVFAKDLGSDYDFNRFEVDLRKYFPINPERKQLIAAQLYIDMARGSPPFYRLPALGGSRTMRGYKQGSLRDRNYIAGQVEFRTQAWWRFGAVAFLGVGDVANEFGDFEFSGLPYSFGGGLRYVFNQDEGINLRADFGVGDGTTGLYVSVEEAF